MKSHHKAIAAIWIGVGMTAYAGDVCGVVAVMALIATFLLLADGKNE